MRSRWVRVTIFVIVALLALSLALSFVPSDARAYRSADDACDLRAAC